MLVANLRKAGVSEDFLRHTRPMVRAGSASAKRRTRRLFIRTSLRTARVGNNVTPTPPATMLTHRGKTRSAELMLLRFGTTAELQSLFAKAMFVLEDHDGCSAQLGSFGGCAFRHERVSRRRHQDKRVFGDDLALDVADFRFQRQQSCVDRSRLKGVNQHMSFIFYPYYRQLRISFVQGGGQLR
jgi:hypothetical protein